MMKLIRTFMAMVAALLAAQAQAATIFSHSFGGGTADLNGTAVDVGTGNWVAGPNFDANGDVNTTSANAGSATMAFTPVNGLIYTLEASFGNLTSTGGWLALGFSAGQSTGTGNGNRFINTNVIGKAWMTNRGTGTPSGDNEAFLGSATSGTSNPVAWTTDSTTYGGNMDLRIVLDTTAGTGNWTATWYANTGSGFTEVRATTTLENEVIDSVGFAVSGNDLSGSINSFSLTSLTPVPEPSSLALLGIGGLLLLRRRR